MKRYTQGFKYFGPLEQCSDGEWCKYEDIKKEMDRLEVKYMKEKYHVVDIYRDSILRKTKEAEFYNLMAALSIAVNVGLIAGFIVSEYLA